MTMSGKQLAVAMEELSEELLLGIITKEEFEKRYQELLKKMHFKPEGDEK